MPGRTHLQHAQPVLLTHHLLAHAWPLVRDVDRLADWAATPATRRTARERWPASPSGLDPAAVAAELGFGVVQPELDRRHVGAGLRRRVRLRLRPGRRGRQPARRGADPLVDPGVRLRPAARLLVDGVEHHAAEEEPRHRRARPRQGRPADRQPDRAARDAQGAAAGLQPRPAGGQGAGLRLRGHPGGAAAGGDRDGRDAGVRHRPDGRAGAAGLLARHRRRRVAGPRGRAVPGGPRGRGRLRAALRGARLRARRADRRRSSPRSRRTSRPACARCSPSRARSPPATGGAARRRCGSPSSSTSSPPRSSGCTAGLPDLRALLVRAGPGGRTSAAGRGAAAR